MSAQQTRMDALSNNLANVDTTAYNRDAAVHKAFPELLLRRLRDDGEMQFPLSGEHPVLGSVDRAPVVGKLGTGVETNEVFTVFEQGQLKETGNPFDLALEGDGFFVVDTPHGERLTRNGSFHLGPEGMLVTGEGYPVLGENGYIRIQEHNFDIDEDGVVTQNAAVADPEGRLVSERENRWEDSQEVDRLRIVDVDQPRYLRKQGDSLYRHTWDSGAPHIAEGADRPRVHQRFLEGANVNPVDQMVQLIEVNRAYEANQRVIQSQDDTVGQLLQTVLRPQ